MREFTKILQTILSVVSNQLELLPESEGEIEEITFVGEEERDDSKLSGDINGFLCWPNPGFLKQHGNVFRNRQKSPESISL